MCQRFNRVLHEHRGRGCTLALQATSVHVDIFISLHTQQGIVRLLRQSDAQLFAGWGGHPSINDVTTLEKIDYLANKAATLLQVSRTSPRRN